MMKTHFDAVIIGAGPAGLTAAIELSRCSWKVLLIEKSEFPRTKVCGGFVGPENIELLQEMGVYDDLLLQGAEKVDRVCLSASNGAQVRIPIASNSSSLHGLALSRKLFDWTLWNKCEEEGVELKKESVAVPTESLEGFDIEVKNWKNNHVEQVTARYLIYANGASKQKGSAASGFFGISALFKNVTNMDKNVFLHFVQNGHLGINQFENGLTNICYVADKKMHQSVGGNLEKLFLKFKEENPVIREQLSGAIQETPWKGMFLPKKSKHRFSEKNIFYLGDQVGLVNPVVGGGISLALSGGQLLASLMGNYEASQMPFEIVAERYESEWKKRFFKRVCWSKLIGNLSHQKIAANNILWLLNRNQHWLEKIFNFYHKPVSLKKFNETKVEAIL